MPLSCVSSKPELTKIMGCLLNKQETLPQQQNRQVPSLGYIFEAVDIQAYVTTCRHEAL